MTAVTYGGFTAESQSTQSPQRVLLFSASDGDALFAVNRSRPPHFCKPARLSRQHNGLEMSENSNNLCDLRVLCVSAVRPP